jgi:hypothetical protein
VAREEARGYLKAPGHPVPASYFLILFNGGAVVRGEGIRDRPLILGYSTGGAPLPPGLFSTCLMPSTRWYPMALGKQCGGLVGGRNGGRNEQ